MTVRRLALVSSDVTSRCAARAAVGPTVRVAIATHDGRALNAHFGSAKRFAVYDVGVDRVRFVETIAFEDSSDESGAHTAESNDRIGTKIRALEGCRILFVLAIGAPVAAKVIHANIHPIKLSSPEPIAAVLSKVRAMLSGPPPPWLRKVLASSAERSMDFLEEEES